MPGRIYDATWGRIFAWGYDWFLSGTEDAGLRDARRELLAQAGGRCLEIGAGTGLNLEQWPQSVDELVLTEPDPHMAAKLRKKLSKSGRRIEVVEAPGAAAAKAAAAAIARPVCASRLLRGIADSVRPRPRELRR